MHVHPISKIISTIPKRNLPQNPMPHQKGGLRIDEGDIRRTYLFVDFHVIFTFFFHFVVVMLGTPFVLIAPVRRVLTSWLQSICPRINPFHDVSFQSNDSTPVDKVKFIELDCNHLVNEQCGFEGCFNLGRYSRTYTSSPEIGG